jgi:uncharacterized protein YqeY
MTIGERLTDDLKSAMRSGDTVRRDVIRLILAAAKNAELVKNGPLTPEEVAAALKAAGLSLSRDQINPALEASWAKRRGEPVAANLDPRAVDALAQAGEAKAAKAGPLTDDEIEEIIQRQAKQRRDSIDAYQAGGRADLAAKEETELAVLLGYLPQPLAPEELRALVREAIAEVGATGPRDMGKVMPAVMARAGKRADGKAVSAVVRELLSE